MYYGKIVKFDIANGLGCRVSLFVSGCRNCCPGCFNMDTWNFLFGQPYTEEVEDKLIEYTKNENICGLTILGGEPFEPENQRSLIKTIRRFKEECPNKNLWMYSGYTFDSDMRPGGKVYTEVTDEILSYVDILVDGRFMQNLKNLSLKFRGSSNQRIIDVKESLKENRVVLVEELMK